MTQHKQLKTHSSNELTFEPYVPQRTRRNDLLSEPIAIMTRKQLPMYTSLQRIALNVCIQIRQLGDWLQIQPLEQVSQYKEVK